MLLALSTLSFFVGFVLAAVVISRPKGARLSPNDLLKNLRHVVGAFIPSASSSTATDSPFSDEKHIVPTDGADLLTKYGFVCPLVGIQAMC